MHRQGALLLVFFTTLLSAVLTFDPNYAAAQTIRSNKTELLSANLNALDSINPSNSLKLWLRSRSLGRAKLTLARNKKQQTKSEFVLPNGQIVPDLTRLALFKGQLIRLSAKQRVKLAASSINHDSELLFILPHRITKRPMLYAVKIQLKNRNFRIKRVPASILSQFSCAENERSHGHQHGHNHAALVSSLLAGAESIKESIKFKTLAASTLAAGTKEIELATLADSDYYAIFGNNSNAQISSLINAVSVIYEAQLSLTINIVQQRTLTSASSLTSSDANTLLTQFDTYLASNPFSVEADIRHLFTGKDMNSGVIGIAYTPGTCDPFGDGADTSLSQYVSSTLDYITVAHEFGHNLNAGHDTTLPATIMYPSASSSQTSFSTTSRNQISAYVDSIYGNCLSTTNSSPTPTATATPTPTPSDGSGGGGGSIGDGGATPTPTPISIALSIKLSKNKDKSSTISGTLTNNSSAIANSKVRLMFKAASKKGAFKAIKSRLSNAAGAVSFKVTSKGSYFLRYTIEEQGEIYNSTKKTVK